MGTIIGTIKDLQGKFFAKDVDGNVISVGGRVLGVTAIGSSIAKAQEQAYKAVDLIDWPQGFCRRDIGWRALKSDIQAA